MTSAAIRYKSTFKPPAIFLHLPNFPPDQISIVRRRSKWFVSALGLSARPNAAFLTGIRPDSSLRDGSGFRLDEWYQRFPDSRRLRFTERRKRRPRQPPAIAVLLHGVLHAGNRAI